MTKRNDDEMDVDPIFALVRNVINIRYHDIPAPVIEASKKLVLDTLGVIVSGSTAPGCREVVGLIKEWGGTRESTILVHGDKAIAPDAALANATMGHALDYDDTHDSSALHASVVVIPTSLAMAERQRKYNGKELLTAITLGLDLGCRMSGATRTRTDLFYDGWDNTQLYGFFSSAATAGKILGLDEEKLLNALGIAYAQASGNVQSNRDAALTLPMGPGFAARGGITSALMAERGITGARHILEGEAGLFNVFFPAGYDPSFLTGDLGTRFEGANISLKSYPCCRALHSFIDATLALVKEHALKPEEVAEVIGFCGEKTYRASSMSLEAKRSPKNIIDAQFSMPWTVATAIVRGRVLIDDFTTDAFKEQTVLRMAQRVTLKLDGNLSPVMHGPVIVQIKTNDGRAFSKRVDSPYGSPENPMNWESIESKFMNCASYAVKPLPKENLEKVVDMAKRLEEVGDIGAIIELLS